MQSTIRVPLVPSAMLNSSRRDRFDGGQPTAAPAAGHTAAPNLLTYRAVSAPSPPLRETAPGTSGLSECSASAKSAAGHSSSAVEPRDGAVAAAGDGGGGGGGGHSCAPPGHACAVHVSGVGVQLHIEAVAAFSSAISAEGTSPADAVECDRVMR